MSPSMNPQGQQPAPISNQTATGPSVTAVPSLDTSMLPRSPDTGFQNPAILGGQQTHNSARQPSQTAPGVGPFTVTTDDLNLSDFSIGGGPKSATVTARTDPHAPSAQRADIPASKTGDTRDAKPETERSVESDNQRDRRSDTSGSTHSGDVSAVATVEQAEPTWKWAVNVLIQTVRAAVVAYGGGDWGKIVAKEAKDAEEAAKEAARAEKLMAESRKAIEESRGVKGETTGASGQKVEVDDDSVTSAKARARPDPKTTAA